MSWSAFRTFTDSDAYHAAISASAGSHSDGVITARGNFRADFARIPLDRVLLRHAEETLPRTAHLALDPRQFLIAFTTDPRQQIYVSGLELVPDAIVVLAAAHASGPPGAANGRSDDIHCDRDSDELCFLGIGPLRGGLSVAVRRDTLGY